MAISNSIFRTKPAPHAPRAPCLTVKELAVALDTTYPTLSAELRRDHAAPRPTISGHGYHRGRYYNLEAIRAWWELKRAGKGEKK